MSWLVLPLALACVAGCGDSAGSSDDPPVSPAIIETIDDVEYYGACGNETLTIGERMYYPLYPDEVDELDEDFYTLVGASLIGIDAVNPSVAEPGPGDDIGTLVVFADGMARFESDSGRVIWLTVEEHTYDFVC